ncbi:NACHT and WD repeat domain-containing protein 2 [Anabarilius grahami]|uniref:NACHT and WD repeat domain-containing protein 2 n=1 Tax=Anabarilius grahami TaxID=495550 RepID=A0A3N0YNZ8_ANAGA|nr:NACHT and WD repeat domain-containing protein 2 [Anabarilius grahami]
MTYVTIIWWLIRTPQQAMNPTPTPQVTLGIHGLLCNCSMLVRAHWICQHSLALQQMRSSSFNPETSVLCSVHSTGLTALNLATNMNNEVVDLYWGIDPEEWDSPELQRLRMKLLEECLKTSAGPCFVVGHSGFQCSSKKEEDCRAVTSDVPCRFAVSGHFDRASKESVATLGPPQKAWGQGQATQPKSLWDNTDLRTVIITKKASKRS